MKVFYFINNRKKQVIFSSTSYWPLFCFPEMSPYTVEAPGIDQAARFLSPFSEAEL